MITHAYAYLYILLMHTFLNTFFFTRFLGNHTHLHSNPLAHTGTHSHKLTRTHVHSHALTRTHTHSLMYFSFPSHFLPLSINVGILLNLLDDSIRRSIVKKLGSTNISSSLLPLTSLSSAQGLSLSSDLKISFYCLLSTLVFLLLSSLSSSS